MAQNSPEQLRAADPRNSVWVSANAGAGKTTVLTSRVVRLLLAGADPARILCVTFTKAAAANMQNKIFEALGKWVALDDAGLAEAIAETTGQAPGSSDITRARRLFARAVETPGGLKIQTIHGFCERLLHLFPFEAGVPARFKVLDDREQRAATEAAINSALNTALADSASILGRALRRATAEAGEDGFREALRAFMAHRRDRFTAIERKYAVSPLRQRLGLGPADTLAAIEREIVSRGLYSRNWREVRDWLRSSGKTRDGDMAGALENGSGNQGEQSLDSYLKAFLTEKLEPRSDKGFFISADLRKERPDLTGMMLDERDRVHQLALRRKAAATAERTESMIALADEVLVRYRAEKRRMGRLDFPDLIGKVVQLLTADTAQWVLFKLDQGLDHVLVDEAQDTSPEQWAIVKALADDFFSGAGARGLNRTIFAVGDEKQSIFGFQGARPEEFASAKEHFQGRIGSYNEGAPTPHVFEEVPLRTSYRTVDDVLKAVDQVFSVEERFAGLSSAHERTQHDSNRQGQPGLVELWPPEEAEDVELVDAFAPVDAQPKDAPAMRLARRVARRIAHWQKTDARFEDDGEPITPGDVLVLVRNRGPIFNGVIKALKQEGVPVAGADRMKLNEQIVVLDLLALGRFCLLPEDDLTLAALLKSPLVGLSEEELLALAHDRGPHSLWTSLLTMADTVPRFAEAAGRLRAWQHRALTVDPYAFYAEVLSADGGRRLLRARLGVDSEEAMNVFLSTLRQWQASNPPSLLGFIETMAANDADVKRDMEEAHGRVRVMTVHGSKGLEARVVFLVDTFHNPRGGGGKGDVLIEIDAGDPDTAVWAPSKAGDPPPVAEARERQTELANAESRRLLYVALTRARDRLYIGGAKGGKPPPADHWRGLIDTALTGHPHLSERDDEAGEGTVLQWRTVPAKAAAPVDRPAAPTPAALPDWLRKAATADLPRPPPLRPSRLADAAEPPPLREGITARAQARLRGDLIHHLLQHLPEVPPDRRAATAGRLAAARFPALDPETTQEAVSRTIALMNDGRFAALFSGDARAEVDIAGHIRVGTRKAEVAGRIDRLAITPTTVTLVDFKTGRPPADPNDVPQSHLSQLAVYETLLADLYPGHEIVTAVVWTALPEIVVLPRNRLEQAMAAITLP